mmetsp:Transcript_8511/g.25007  ORF Transcript_8511/g.25007 Transcript_8511/m.25007 type:complete len:339 (+) Transcript_8511:1501-2517(+)
MPRGGPAPPRLHRPGPRAPPPHAARREDRGRAKASAGLRVRGGRAVRAARLPRPRGAAAVHVLPALLLLHEPQLLRPRHPQGPALAAQVEVLPLEHRSVWIPPLHCAHVHNQLHLRHRRVCPRGGHLCLHPPLQRGDGLGLGAARAALPDRRALAPRHRHAPAPAGELEAATPPPLPAPGGGPGHRDRGTGARRQQRGGGAHAPRRLLPRQPAAPRLGPHHRVRHHPPPRERGRGRPGRCRVRRLGEAPDGLPHERDGRGGLLHDRPHALSDDGQGLCHPSLRPGAPQPQHRGHGVAMVVEEGPAQVRTSAYLHRQPVHAPAQGHPPRAQPQGFPDGG